MKKWLARHLMLVAMRLNPHVAVDEMRRRHGTWYNATHPT